MKACLNFPEPRVMSSNCHFSSSDSQKPKDSSFTIMIDKQRQQVLAVKKLESVSVRYICSENDWNDWLIIKIVKSKFQERSVLLVECLGYYGKDVCVHWFCIIYWSCFNPHFSPFSLLIDWSLQLLHSSFVLCGQILLRTVLLGVQPDLDWHLSNLSFTLFGWDDLHQRQATNSGGWGVKWAVIVSFYSTFYVTVEGKQRSFSFSPTSLDNFDNLCNYRNTQPTCGCTVVLQKQTIFRRRQNQAGREHTD